MAEIKNDWEFLVRCYSPHLVRACGERSTGYDMQFYTVPSHYHEGVSDDFRFKTWFCNEIVDENEAFSIACELLSLFNGGCNILYKEHHKVELEEIFRNGRHASAIGMLKQKTIRLKEINSVSENDRARNLEASNGMEIFRLINLSKTRDDVFHLLKVFSSDLDWSRLYTVLESVERFAKENGVSITKDDNKRELFTRTANNFAALGMEARHGEKNWQPPAQPMELDVAKTYIKDLVKEYLGQI